MNKFFSNELGLNVITRKGDEAFLPDDNALISVVYFEGANVFEVVSDGIRRSGGVMVVKPTAHTSAKMVRLGAMVLRPIP